MKYKFQHSTDRLLIFIIVMLLALLAAILWVYGVRIHNLENVVTPPYSNTNTVTPELGYLIQSSERSLYVNSVVTDAATQRVYVPEARIYLPMSSFSRTLYYDAVPADGSSPAEYDFNPLGNLNRVVTNFNDTTCVNRVAGFTVNKKTAAAVGSSYQGSVSLADGRTLYLYQNENAAHCANYWFGRGAGAVIDLLKQAKSY